jgi:hypothetical protein
VRDAGADGIEIVACNGYILHQFLSSAINDRDDEYNGDLRARARLTLDVLRAVRAAVGRDFFVSMKLSGRDEHNAYTAPLVRAVGNTLADTMELSRWLADAGLDAIHLSQGDRFHPLILAGRPPGMDDDACSRAVLRGTRASRSCCSSRRRHSSNGTGDAHAIQHGACCRTRSRHEPGRCREIKRPRAALICVGGWQTRADPGR